MKATESTTAVPHDPRIGLILVEADTVHYSKKDRTTPMVLFQMAKANAHR